MNNNKTKFFKKGNGARPGATGELLHVTASRGWVMQGESVSPAEGGSPAMARAVVATDWLVLGRE